MREFQREFPKLAAALKRLSKIVIAFKGNQEDMAQRSSMTSEEFKALRKALGLKQHELAKVLEVTQSTIFNAEKHGPTRAILHFLDYALASGRLRLPGVRIVKFSKSKKIRPQ